MGESRIRTYVVIPSNRDLQSIEAGWQESDLNKHPLILVEDKPTKTIKLPAGYDCIHYSHKEIDEVLGSRSWIIPRGDSAIKSFGFYMAMQQGADAVLSLDDDVVAQHPKFVEQHEQFLSFEIVSNTHGIINTVRKQGTANVPQKGLPKNYEKKKQVVMSFGLQYGYLDLPATYIRDSGRVSCNGPQASEEDIQDNQYASISGSNVAIRVEALPAYYQLLMGKEWGLGKYGDVWSGLIFQKICHHLGKGILMGHPMVFHKGYGDNDAAIEMEAGGYDLNEYFWEQIPKLHLTGKTFRQCYLEVANWLPTFPEKETYMKKTQEAMRIWADLF